MDFNKYVKSEGRPLPVFLLVDVSGSMHGQKIDTVNVALKEMINQFRTIENPKGIIQLCIVTFGGGGAHIIKPLSEIKEDDVYVLSASGDTPMGAALQIAYDSIEDYNVVSSRAYTPTIVLISDGNPTSFNANGKSVDEIKKWSKMSQIHSGTRTSKAVRLAMGIGDDMNINLLKAFINNESVPVIMAKDHSTISKFFEWVTMTVSVRSVSANPNLAQVVDPGDIFDEDEVDFES